jgi:hypothetical protein
MSSVEKRGAVTGDYGYVEFDYQPSGWLMFAGLMVLFTGFWNVIEGSIAVFRSTYFTGTAVFGSLVFWSLVWFGVGLLALIAGYAIIGGREWGRWAGIVIVILSTIVNMLTIPLYPWWSLFVVTIDILILYALTVRWRRIPGTAAG